MSLASVFWTLVLTSIAFGAVMLWLLLRVEYIGTRYPPPERHI